MYIYIYIYICICVYIYVYETTIPYPIWTHTHKGFTPPHPIPLHPSLHLLVTRGMGQGGVGCKHLAAMPALLQWHWYDLRTLRGYRRQWSQMPVLLSPLRTKPSHVFPKAFHEGAVYSDMQFPVALDVGLAAQLVRTQDQQSAHQGPSAHAIS